LSAAAGEAAAWEIAERLEDLCMGGCCRHGKS